MREIVQSANDTPCRVRFGGDGRRPTPTMELSKWGERAFLSMTGNGGNMRAVRESGTELLLAAGHEAHRYRRLDAVRFEYDVILLERPRVPRVSLDLLFPEGLEFYRQRSLHPEERHTIARDPFVEGSYAVYWHERNGEFRTGKFCHIYRPKLMDARGAWTWGELEFHDATLDILLPEEWLKQARYPVIVDPIVGSSSVGASHLIQDGEDWIELRYELSMPVNRFQAPGMLLGECTASFYCYQHDSEAAGIPVIYADSSGNPGALLSSQAGLINFDTSSDVWRSGTFNLTDPIEAGQYLWFGAQALYQFLPCFDDGGSLRRMDTESYSSPPSNFVSDWSESRILSMYFSYTASQAYSAAVLDGVRVTDGRNRMQTLWRGIPANRCSVRSSCAGLIALLRRCVNVASSRDVARRIADFTRRRFDSGSPAAGPSRSGTFLRGLRSLSGATAFARRGIRIVLRIADGFRLWDYLTNRRLATYEVVTLSSRVTLELEIESRL